MKTLKELVGEKERIWVELTPKDYEPFLNFAKANHCTWIDESKNYNISIFENHPAFAFIEIDSNGTIGFIPVIQWCKTKTEKHKINFSMKP
jgi:hypothetical protein